MHTQFTSRPTLLGLMSLTLLLCACGSAAHSTGATTSITPTPDTSGFTGLLRGTVTAPDCTVYGLLGATVTVRNEANTVIGSAPAIVTDNTPPIHEGAYAAKGHCAIAFTVANLPRAAFYQFQIGTHAGPAYSFAELAAQSWTVTLSLS